MLLSVDEYEGNLTIRLLQDSRFNNFILDIYNVEGSRLRFRTNITQENIPEYFLRKATFEDWIETLLEKVVIGEYKKYPWLPFSTVHLDNKTLKTMIELTRANYRKSEKDTI